MKPLDLLVPNLLFSIKYLWKFELFLFSPVNPLLFLSCIQKHHYSISTQTLKNHDRYCRHKSRFIAILSITGIYVAEIEDTNVWSPYVLICVHSKKMLLYIIIRFHGSKW